jgi:hypothetical protein
MIIIDRIEGKVAILEIGEALIEVPASLLPAGAREGDPLVLSLAASDSLATAGQQETVERVERLRASDPGDMDIDI